MKHLLLLTSLVASLGASAASAASAASVPCSVHAKKGTTHADFMRLAKISKADAEIMALKAVNIGAASIEDSELNSETGYLISSLEIKSSGKESVAKVTVDAGTSKLLAVVPNSARAQPDKLMPAASAKP